MERGLFRLDAARLRSCCPLCATGAPVSPVAGYNYRVLRTLASHTSEGIHRVAHVGVAAERWPDRPELKVTASEKLADAPDPSFPSIFPLQFIAQHTGLAVRSVSEADFAVDWRNQFRAILEAKGASAQHDEFWATGASNGRALQWRLLEIPPNSAYPLHIHPGIEVYLVVRGVLHEWRMVGPPLIEPHQFDGSPELVARALDFAGQGASFERQFEQNCLQEGGFNVNEIGSVHQVFTQAEGCILLVLGAGANVTIEPEQYPVTGHPFVDVTVAGTSGWQGQTGGRLVAQDVNLRQTKMADG